MTSKRILVTGAGGTIGYEILKQLKNSDHTISVFDLETKKNKRKFKAFAKIYRIIYGDISNPDDIAQACKNQDIVIHLAAIIPPLADEKPGLTHRVNYMGSKHLIEALTTFSPNAFLLYASSVSVYGDRLTTPEIRVGDTLHASENDYYARTKIETEQLVKASTLSWSIFRLSAIMGVNNHKISPLMFHQPLLTKMEICTPGDTARAFVHAIDHLPELRCKIFNLGGGENCRIDYKSFLSTSFKLYGLGKLNFQV